MTQDEIKREGERLHVASFGWALPCCGRGGEEGEGGRPMAYLRVLEGAAHFGARASPKTWLFSVIRRTAAQERRKRHIRSLALVRWVLRQPPPANPKDPEASLAES